MEDGNRSGTSIESSGSGDLLLSQRNQVAWKERTAQEAPAEN